MAKRSFILIVAAVFIIYACKTKTVKDAEPAKLAETEKKLMPEIAACDSAAVMYYHTPGNPRFFSMTKVYDKGSIEAFSTQVNGSLITGKDSCVTEGKIYFYGKGDAVHVVYFSRVKECMTLSFIKTGVKYFTRMEDNTKQLLEQWQKKAVSL